MQENFGVVIEIQSTATTNKWTLVIVYGSCVEPRRSDFVQWLDDIVILDDDLWLIMEDSKFYRYGKNRKRDGVNYNDMFIFKKIISHLALQETY